MLRGNGVIGAFPVTVARSDVHALIECGRIGACIVQEEERINEEREYERVPRKGAFPTPVRLNKCWCSGHIAKFPPIAGRHSVIRRDALATGVVRGISQSILGFEDRRPQLRARPSESRSRRPTMKTPDSC